MKVSVVIPTCARTPLLLEALASVACQTLPAEEVCVVDDAADPTLKVRLDELGLPLRYLSCGPGRGASAARNLGARAACGELLAFLDDDDCWEPRYLEQAVAQLRATGSQAVVTWIQRFSTRGSWPGRSVRPALRAGDVLAVNPGVTGSNLLIHRSVLLALGGYDEGLAVSNDKDLLVRLLDAGVTYAVVAERLVRKRMHDARRIGTPDARRIEGLRAYRAKYERRLTRADRRRLAADLAALERLTASRRRARLLASLRTLVLLGPIGLRRRLAERTAARRPPVREM